eukprot:897311-Alexandrium_andersonii.AAC.1
MARPSVIFAVCRRGPHRHVFGNGVRKKAGPSSSNRSKGSTKQPRVAPKCSIGRTTPCQPMSAWSAASS